MSNAQNIVNRLLEMDVDDVPTEHLVRMGRAGECQERCPRCGAYCTLIHSQCSDGTTVPPYHICKTCDLKSCEEAYTFPDYGEQEKDVSWGEPDVPKAAAPDPDDPAAFIGREVARRAEPIQKLEVYGRRWFRRGAGGVYCTARIYINDKLVHTTPEMYGYGEHYLTLAADWLERNGYINRQDPSEPLWRTAQRMGFRFERSVEDVRRERDLFR